jgi:hypothetical protein
MVSVGVEVAVCVGVCVAVPSSEELPHPATAGIAAVPSAVRSRRRVVNRPAVDATSERPSDLSVISHVEDRCSIVVKMVSVANVSG